jgi:hypothetical protein
VPARAPPASAPSPRCPTTSRAPAAATPRRRAGEAVGALVPQAVLGRDGRPLDVDLVLSEAASDGGELTVEYGPGPLAFQSRRAGRGGRSPGAQRSAAAAARARRTCRPRPRSRRPPQHYRWDGRPRSPPFRWADAAGGGEHRDAPDAWLAGLDPAAEGLGGLQEPEFLATAPAAGADDLARVKEALTANAGALQMLFLLGAADAAAALDGVNRLTLAQAKALLAAARVVGPGGVAADAIDRAFALALASPGALARCGLWGGAGGRGGLGGGSPECGCA